jgi:hypothetical protein
VLRAGLLLGRRLERHWDEPVSAPSRIRRFRVKIIVMSGYSLLREAIFPSTLSVAITSEIAVRDPFSEC